MDPEGERVNAIFQRLLRPHVNILDFDGTCVIWEGRASLQVPQGRRLKAEAVSLQGSGRLPVSVGADVFEGNPEQDGSRSRTFS